MVSLSWQVQLASTAEQLEGLAKIDGAIQDMVMFVQDAYEQFNFKVLHPEESNLERPHDETFLQLSEEPRKPNLLGKQVP